MQLAYRISWQLGVDDPESWLDTVPPAVLAGWQAWLELQSEPAPETEPATPQMDEIEIGEALMAATGLQD